MQRMTEDGELAGPAHHRRERVRPRDGAQALRAKGLQARVQRQRLGDAARGDPAAVPPRRQAASPSPIATRGVGGDIELPETWRVNLDDALIDRLRDWLKPENVQVVY